MEASPEFFTGDIDHKPLDYLNGHNNFKLDEFLDFPREDEVMTEAYFDANTGNSGESSVTVVDSCNSSVSGGDGQFNGSLSCRSFTDIPLSGNELCVPYDDLADLEWLSNFVEESFSTDDLQNLHLTATTQKGNAHSATTDTSSPATTPNITNPSPIFPSDIPVPGKARSKRSRTAPCDWSSRLLLLSRSISSPNSTNLLNSQPKSPKTAPSRRRDLAETPGRRCLHCSSDKTPQWRTGPMGPKTLCNACGVRYKSGRLVPEYRPAASPTFVSAKHSNSHRKVIELRRQKEIQMQQHQEQHLLNQASIFGISNGGDDYFPLHRQQNNFSATDYRLF